MTIHQSSVVVNKVSSFSFNSPHCVRNSSSRSGKLYFAENRVGVVVRKKKKKKDGLEKNVDEI